MNKKESLKKEVDLKKYKNEDSLSLGQMKIGLWLSVNRRRLMRIIIIFLIICSATFFTYSSYHYIIYFLYGREADKKLTTSLTENLIDIQSYREATAPQIMLAGAVNSFLVNDKQDFVVSLKNPNLNYYGVFDYCLQDAQKNDVACGSSFILPNSEKQLILPSQEIKDGSGKLTFQTVNVYWQRLNYHEIPSWDNYLKEHLNISVTNLVYLKPDYNARTPLHEVSFTIKNNSPYHFAKLPLDILLSNGSSISGVNVYNLTNFMSLESRDLRISWPAAGERASNVEIIPDVNILDESVFLPYRG